MKNETIVRGPKNSPKRIILGHGAGAPMDSEWMEQMTDRLVKRGIRVIRFNFPYMVKSVEESKKYPPNSKKILLESWEKIIEKERRMQSLFIGGKSMGGRMASLIADEQNVDGLVCLGYPFHAPGKDVGERADHLKKIVTPTLIVQGTRDSMGSIESVKKLRLSKKVKTHWLETGEHSFKPLKKSGYTLEDHLDGAADAVDQFMTKVLGL